MTAMTHFPLERPSAVLCAFDFSDSATQALRCAVAVAARHPGCRLHVVVVTEALLADAARAMGHLAELERQTLRDLRQLCDRLVPSYWKWAPKANLVVRSGDPAREILKFAAEEHCDLVVMGTHGMSGIQKLVIGSTAERVLRMTETPVLVVPDAAASGIDLSDARGRLWVGTVVAPVDLTAASEGQTILAGAVATDLGAPLILVHALSALDAPAEWKARMQAYEQGLIDRTQLRLKELAARSGAVQVEARVERGRPADAIARVTEEEGARLIVMGLRTGSGLVGPAPGAVAYRVLCLTSAMVLALPHRLMMRVVEDEARGEARPAQRAP
jgi:nucleotide-binding universal stress UspA family protein